MSTSEKRQIVFASGYAEAGQPGIRIFELDASSGALTPIGSYSGIVNPSFLALHPSGRWLYAASETGDGAVWAFAIDHETWTLQPLNQQPSGGDAPCHLAIDRSGRWLVVSNYSSGSARVLPIADDGSLGEPSDSIQHHGHGSNAARQDGPHAHSATFMPGDRFVIVADLGIDQLVIYAFDSAAGTLREHGRAEAHPGAGPRHIAVNRGATTVYVANELDSTAAVYAFDSGAGTLRERQTISALPPDAGTSQAAHLALSDAGDRLYVSNRGDNSIAVFDVADDGSLSLRAAPSCGGDWPRHFAIAPGGGWLLVANQYSGDVRVLPIGGDTGLGDPVARVEVPQASCVLFVSGV